MLLALAAALLVQQADSVPLYPDLGDLHHPIATSSPLAQQYFDQGLRLTYGFNHAEAIRSFKRAQQLDPACAMCWWGEALAYGPNINGAMDSASGVAAWASIRRAAELAAHSGDVDRAWVAALGARYAADPVARRAPLDTAYATAMAALAERYPDNDDALVLAADAQMNLGPWDYYTSDGTPKPNAARALSLLERVLTRSPDHPGACHFFIHAVEAADPERAIPCAERLPDLMPGAGHIVHMPAHVYIRVGRYADAIDRNVHAVHADEQHLADLAPDGAYRLAYYPHNYHFLWFAATMVGRSKLAIEAAENTARNTNRTLLRAPGLGALQHYLMTPLFARVRFKKWDAVLATPKPDADLAYAVGVWHYGRAVALSHTGRLAEATRELDALRSESDSPKLEGMTIWGFNSGRDVLRVAIEAAAGEIALARGATRAAITHFQRGVELEDQLIYDEPPTWHLPVRQQLGRALLRAGFPEEALPVFQEDLRRHPANGWSLAGVRDAYRAMKLPEKAREADLRFREAWRDADVAVN